MRFLCVIRNGLEATRNVNLGLNASMDIVGTLDFLEYENNRKVM